MTTTRRTTEAATTSAPEPFLQRGRLDTGAAAARAAELFGEHRRMVLGVCRMLLRNPHDAEDATQQTFLSAYRSMLAGGAPRHPAGWLATIARNECLARIRTRMREPLHEVRDAPSELADPLTTAIRRADLDALLRAIGELPRPQRDALLLREFSGLSYEELATALAVSAPAVESLLFRARRDLRLRLQGLAPASLAPAAALRAAFDWIASLSATAKVVAGTAAVSIAAGGTALTLDSHVVQPIASGRHLGLPAEKGSGPGAPGGGSRAGASAFVVKSGNEAAAADPARRPDTSSGTNGGRRSEQPETASDGGGDGSSPGATPAGAPSDGEDPSSPGGSGGEHPAAGGGSVPDDGGSTPSGDDDPGAAAAPGDDDGSGSEPTSGESSDSSETAGGPSEPPETDSSEPLETASPEPPDAPAPDEPPDTTS